MEFQMFLKIGLDDLRENLRGDFGIGVAIS